MDSGLPLAFLGILACTDVAGIDKNVKPTFEAEPIRCQERPHLSGVRCMDRQERNANVTLEKREFLT